MCHCENASFSIDAQSDAKGRILLFMQKVGYNSISSAG